ncbi:hypothetical protein Y88_1531 [Novosphingobium nitrogenifigens DSM 19370]|uniref:Uncharacterized protein n=1 Tax=Novosphingobium nitrogenifigens DSM 19370 TaxID=983920 RepID=F1Z7I5_9SPHN|nr:TorF family putative porin [Novosphingobium nitrogenifigens]EGD59376.1 hypothetical protein Y88_1531 [Novosphingobium nitrogenifigens DSM 19370]
MRTTAKAMLASSVLAMSTFVAVTPALADDTQTSPPSQWTITGSAAVASQYRFRGVAQSDNRPVIQGALTVSHASGFYVSTWGSSASGGDSPVQIGGTEIDVYAGYTRPLGKSGITIDGGLYGYIYPGAPNGNYYEIYASLTKAIGPVTAKIGGNFAPSQTVFNYNWSSPAHHNMYAYAELGVGIPKTPISLHSHIAHTGGGFDYGRDYWDYTVGATVKWKNLALDASLVGTNLGRQDFARNGLANDGEGGIDRAKVEAFYRTGKPVAVVSLTASF